ncbi:bifunctional 4-hydroxy-2-oxoglutarate aldolase/2-dehydro-3-deoxy-phosphogluconate aldolase (plasmid) [Embleya sp. NBC_00888]|uniref:bifunctional 4-hydroxy-2-oxoglutarate aldolase/2-dehydro-3-deoxy-phosphogluconate aldolase n=1 Tax=Embleya sp. NBC_00888 TaxID=2975960 RepID=UPI002F9093FE|nr:bifunctional 4-hydroxy-2-oxoglutarate aldolase/2-dehydro-3-deoxy-phosphogluconate aldolase [Embleya sp. NBC_00888]
MTRTLRTVPSPAAVSSITGGRERIVTETIAAGGLIAILRAPTAKNFPALTDALVSAGIRAIEVTLTTQGALPCLSALTAAYGDDVVIGAGTVMTADQAEACIEAGASFLVSPVASPDVAAAARIAGVAAYPGALTPTEIAAAVHAGAAAVKLFPASAVPPRFITDMHGPLPGVPIIPTGGITLLDIPAWISAGAAAVGLGGPLIGNDATDGVTASLTSRARKALNLIAAARSTP